MKIVNKNFLLSLFLCFLFIFSTISSVSAAGNFWTPTGSMTVARAWHTATLLPSGKVLVAGGLLLSSAELYNPSTGTWTLTGSMNVRRADFSATLLQNGLVLVAGGFDTTWHEVSSAELYNPTTGNWSLTGSMNTARANHEATLLDDGRVLVTGGSIAYQSSVTPTAEIFDPLTGTWTNINSMIDIRRSHAATLLKNGKVLVTGGEGPLGVRHASAELFDPATGNWSMVNPMNNIHEYHVSILLPNGNVFVPGGFTTSTEIYNPNTNNWTLTGSMNEARSNGFAVLLNNGKVLAGGGCCASKTAELFDPITGVWSTISSMSENREILPVTVLKNGQVLVAGGNFNNTMGGSVASAELYTPEDNIPPVIFSSSPIDGTTTPQINKILITYSEDLIHNSGANAVNNVSNYVLVEAKDNIFQTSSCNATDFLNDTRININSATYDNNFAGGPYRVTLGINNGIPLPKGEYKLFVCGTTSVTDLAGNKINGGADAAVTFFVSQITALPQTGFALGKRTKLPDQPQNKDYQDIGSITLEIPSLNIKAPIIGVPQLKDGWDLTWLGNQVGWLEGTTFPTWSGNSALTAHVVDANGQPGLFRDLGNLIYGNEIIINAWGQRYVYQVRSVKSSVKPNDLSAFKHQDYPYLTLVTCKGYDEKSDTYRWRVVVQAVQLRVE